MLLVHFINMKKILPLNHLLCWRTAVEYEFMINKTTYFPHYVPYLFRQSMNSVISLTWRDTHTMILAGVKIGIRVHSFLRYVPGLRVIEEEDRKEDSTAEGCRSPARRSPSPTRIE